MTRLEDSGLHLLECSNCFGNWMPYVTLLRFMRGGVPTANGAAAPGDLDSGPPAPGNPGTPAAAEPTLEDLAAVVVESNTTKTLQCPECHVDLHKDRVHPMIPVQVDRCPHCDYVWLDVGKRPLMRRLWTELQSSTDERIVQLREKVAQASAAWAGRSRLSDDLTLEIYQTRRSLGPLGGLYGF
jgi:Zn-finger nucleic acid-binding protein